MVVYQLVNGDNVQFKGLLWGLKLKILKFSVQCWYKEASNNLQLFLLIIIGVIFESSAFQHFFYPSFSDRYKNTPVSTLAHGGRNFQWLKGKGMSNLEEGHQVILAFKLLGGQCL